MALEQMLTMTEQSRELKRDEEENPPEPQPESPSKAARRQQLQAAKEMAATVHSRTSARSGTNHECTEGFLGHHRALDYCDSLGDAVLLSIENHLLSNDLNECRLPECRLRLDRSIWCGVAAGQRRNREGRADRTAAGSGTIPR